MSDLNGPNASHRSDLEQGWYEISEVIDDRSNLTDSQRFLVEFFENKTEGKRFACREDLNPEEITSYLPFVSIFDLETDDKGKLNDIKIRLLGTALVDFYGEWTGRTVYSDMGEESLKKIHPETYKRLVRMVNLVIEKRMPIILYSSQVSNDRSYWEIRNLAIPLSENGTDIEMVFMHSELTKRI